MSERQQEFKTPSAKFRGTPFWAWNCNMTRKKADLILGSLKDMGMGGAYFHCRTGMDMPYLGKEFMDMMHYAHDKAGEAGMLTCLYDEDRWPSGFAGGLVTKEEKYRSRFLVFSPEELLLEEKMEAGELKSCAQAVSSGKRKFLAAYGIRLEQGFLVEYCRLNGKEDINCFKNKSEFHIWYAYLEISGDNPWFNNQAYLNTLDEKAVARFIQVTYDAYFKEFGEDFGNRIPYIFTDEPQFTFKTQLGYAGDLKKQVIPYTDDFDETYQAEYKDGFLEHLPEIFWELPEANLSVHRYRYHDHVCERFTRAYMDQIGDWCKKHHIGLTGHMMREPFLEGQTMALGEAMRAYRSMDVPGIDMLCDRRELTTAKQAQSAVHQFGCKGMTSEIYGVTNWDFDFRGHKLAGDWQAALGVTNRVHHLTWTTMRGEAKRDYPAPIGYQSPWYKDYPYIEDYFSRLNTILTRGKAVVRLGVIHPIESYWLYWGTKEHTDAIRNDQEEKFGNLVKWLLYGLIDFDYISESLLSSEKDTVGNGFSMGEMKYDVIIVPDLVTIRHTTLNKLNAFANQGGRVIFAGRVPEYVDAMPSLAAVELSERCQSVMFSGFEIISAVEDIRFVDIRNQEGVRTDNILYQLRRDEMDMWLYLAHSEKSPNSDMAWKEKLHITINGTFRVEQWMAQTGEIKILDATNREGKTGWSTESYEHDSFLYHLIQDAAETTITNNFTHKKEKSWEPSSISIPSETNVVFEEPNVLLLDIAEFAFDDQPWQQEEEVLRIDNLFRKKLGYPMRTEAFAQPWVNKRQVACRHTLRLRFTVQTDLVRNLERNVTLALELSEGIRLFFNDKEITARPEGWYVDHDIQTLSLGNLRQGKNCLEVHIPFHEKTHVEAMYLLGNFSVFLKGKNAVIMDHIQQLGFGDICPQGLPFYGGNICYQTEIFAEEKGFYAISFKKFRCSAVRVAVDGKEKGLIAISPYQIELGELKAGKHILQITALGNRVNTFGPVHNCNQTELWIGPDAWRSKGMAWAYEYQLKPTGFLASPVLLIERKL